jgi:hypothetical protein
VIQIITEGQKTGEFQKDDPKKLALLLLSTIKGLTHLAIHQSEIFKTYYPYTDTIMRLVVKENCIADKAQDTKP